MIVTHRQKHVYTYFKKLLKASQSYSSVGGCETPLYGLVLPKRICKHVMNGVKETKTLFEIWSIKHLNLFQKFENA